MPSSLRAWCASLALVTSLAALTSQATVLDNFDDNTKTGWKDFTFIPGLGLPTEASGQFRFEMPPVGQAIFSASQKESQVLELKEGRSIEMRVDVIEGGGKDSFAVLAFIPQSTGPGSLGGYGIAKSTTDILITKGIGKYFIADNGPAANLKNENITLVLKLTVKDGNVIVNSKALDKENSNAVLWERTVIDTPEADVLADGTDEPAVPYITKGYFTLYLYQDFDGALPENPYKIYYDNAQVEILDSTVLDNFDDNAKTGWKDFTFIPGFGIPSEAEGQFKFVMPPAGQGIFSASQKTSRVFELKEGERTEFRVDVIEGGAKDSFAVLAFIPQSTGPGSLGGYGLAKSTTDILITKGVGKYFIADNGPTAHLKNENITLVLSMEVKDGNVIVHTEALDKDADNAILWERTVIDTPEADILADGIDDPAGPFITKGYFTLYLYQDFDGGAVENPYKISYDNAIVIAPPLPDNIAPLLSEITPDEFASFLPADTAPSFKVTDDQDLVDNRISITLNGVRFTTANGLTLTGAGSTRTATLPGKLAAGMDYTAVLAATDAAGAEVSKTIYFDTFTSENTVVEVEDYNFSGGVYFNAPIVIPEGTGPQESAYSLQEGTKQVDYSDTRSSPSRNETKYRPQDTIRMQHSLDNARAKFVEAGGAEAQVYDYDVGDIAANEWMNYTRDFPSGAYEVYLREALANLATADSVLEQVISDPAVEDQAVKSLGTFLGTRTGFVYRNFGLTDGSGQNKIRLNLQGVTTLRLRHLTPDGDAANRFMNYMIFVRVGDIEFQRAFVNAISPAPESTVETLNPAIHVELQNKDTVVNPATISLVVNGATVTPTITTTDQGSTVDYALSTLPASGAINSATVSFQDNQGQTITSTWSFSVSYKSLNPANRAVGTAETAGFNVHVVQAPAGSSLPNTLVRAEEQIKNNSSIERTVDVTEAADLINYNKTAGRTQGVFPDDVTVPGIDPAVTGNGTDDFTAEVTTYLQLGKGIYRFGVISDDGYKLSSGKNFADIISNTLAGHSGGPANETVDFVVTEPGLYPFRLLWYERAGAGFAEWFSIDRTTGERTLINDPNTPDSIKAYRALSSVSVSGSTDLEGNYAPEASVSVDTAAKTLTVTVTPSTSRLFKVQAPEGWVLKSVTLVGNQLVIVYQ